MRLFRPLLVVAAMTSLAACSLGEPFVERDRNNLYNTPTVPKPKRAGYNGFVNVCYTSDTLPAERDLLAAEACTEWGLTAVLSYTQRWQCRMTVPHLAVYACIDPAMRNEDGSYVNPFEEEAVTTWRKTHPAKTTPAPAPAPESP
ncbi:hypothetical protein [Magnetospirillum molischianum]|uniref:Lipoprotein n=1 Tax=Magnetospirillum molischianum DSM 120 TaxID=1150626 RepID=H8FUA2_MAGML|nr:hypothetical protein [Magnetospirillum molischianum]CCG41940.1 conserved exported hypothetical protein [Magnetospirillum molischianum DSM 120]